MTHTNALYHVIGFHLAIVLGAGIALATMPARQAIWMVVVTYNLALPVYFYRRGNRQVVELWSFLLPLSLLQVVPDWYLTVVQQTLVFPTATGPSPVPLFMAGLWTFPLILTTAVGLYIRHRHGRYAGYAAALVTGLVVFAGGELLLTRLGIWQARQVAAIGGLAYYILPAELMLTAATLYAYDDIDWRSPLHRLAAAPVVMLVYLGSTTTSYLVVEQWLP